MSAPSPSESGDSSRIADARLRRRVRRRRTMVVLVFAVIVFSLLVEFGWPAFQRWRIKRNRELNQMIAATAAAALKQGAGEKAIKLLGKAYQNDPHNPELLRLIAKSIDQTPGVAERSSYFWRMLINLSAATLEDRAAYGISLVREGARKEAEKVYESIPDADLRKRPVLELKAALMQADGQAEEAAELLRATYLSDADNAESRFKLAMLDLTSPFVELQEGAVKALWDAARSGGYEASHAMRILANQTRMTVAQANEIRELLGKNSEIGEEQRFNVLNGVLRALPHERERIIEDETLRLQDQPIDNSATFYRWLVNNNEDDRVLTLLSRQDAVRTSDLFIPYVTALEHRRRWSEIREIIKQYPVIPVSPSTINIILARCAHGLRESGVRSSDHLQEGVKQAILAKDYPGIFAIGNAADELGQPEVALEAFNYLASKPELKLAMWEKMIQIYRRLHKLPEMINLAFLCMSERPDYSNYIETWCYLKLLEGTEMEHVAEIIHRHAATKVEHGPGLPLIEALVAYRYQDLDSAGRTAESIGTAKLQAGQRAVLAGILQSCGRSDEAFKLAEKIPYSLMLIEESHFLRELF